MTIIYVTENNCQCYGVTLQNKGWVRVQKLKDVSEDKNNIYKVNWKHFRAKANYVI